MCVEPGRVAVVAKTRIILWGSAERRPVRWYVTQIIVGVVVATNREWLLPWVASTPNLNGVDLQVDAREGFCPLPSRKSQVMAH
jgi:hypothetical protein